jgi:hypothetical protein
MRLANLVLVIIVSSWLPASVHASLIKTISADDYAVGDVITDPIHGVKLTAFVIDGLEFIQRPFVIREFQFIDRRDDETVLFRSNTFPSVSGSGQFFDYFEGKEQVDSAISLRSHRPLEYIELFAYSTSGDAPNIYFLDSDRNFLFARFAADIAVRLNEDPDLFFWEHPFAFSSELPFHEVWIGAASAAYIQSIGFSFASVPEPTSLALFGIGLAGLGYVRRKKAHGPGQSETELRPLRVD